MHTKEDFFTLELSKNVSGPLPFRMTNDFLFKYLLQSETNTLKGVVCAFLELDYDEIKTITVTNPIELGNDIDSKEMILDVKAILNDNTIINLEMQVVNRSDWPERSISYLCRCFDNLSSGVGYSHVKGAVHIGFLDYTLFPECPEFFSRYELINRKTGKIYTSKFSLNVVDLTLIKAATEDDIKYHRNLWAEFFKATTWEELFMLAEKDEHINKTVFTVLKLSEEEKLRLQCEAREDRIRQEIDFREYYENQIKEREDTIEQQNVQLKQQNMQLEQQNMQLEQKDHQLETYRKLLIDAGIDPDKAHI